MKRIGLLGTITFLLALAAMVAAAPVSAQNACPNCGIDGSSSDENFEEEDDCGTDFSCEVAPKALLNLTGENFTQTITESSGVKVETITSGRVATLGGEFDGWVGTSSVYECDDDTVDGNSSTNAHCTGGLQSNCPAECSTGGRVNGFHFSQSVNVKTNGDFTATQTCIKENGDGWSVNDDEEGLYLGHTLSILDAVAQNIHDDVIEVDCGSNVVVRDLYVDRANIFVAADPHGGDTWCATDKDLEAYTVDVQDSFVWLPSEAYQGNWRRYKEGESTDNYKYQGSGGVFKTGPDKQPRFILKRNKFLYAGVTGTTSSGFAENGGALIFPPLHPSTNMATDCEDNVIYFAGTGSATDTDASNTDLGRLFAMGTNKGDGKANNYARFHSTGGYTGYDSCFTIITRQDTSASDEASWTLAQQSSMKTTWKEYNAWEWWGGVGANQECQTGFSTF